MQMQSSSLSSVKVLRWHGQRVLDALTPFRMLAFACCALWLGLQWQVIGPLKDLKSAYRAEASALISSRPAGVQLSSRVQHRLEETLPTLTQREVQVERLMQLADRKALALGRLDYRAETVPSLEIVRQRIKVKVVGAYALQRSFLNEILATMPNAAVDRLVLEKRPDQASEMTAILEISLFYRSGEMR